MKTTKSYRWWIRCASILLIVLSYGFLVWMLVRYEHYDELLASLQSAGWKEWLLLLAAVGLFPLNILLESCKWKRLIGGISLQNAQRQVYFGMIGAFATPQRLGEYPARLLLMDKPMWVKGLSLSVIGACTMDVVILLLGAGTLPFFIGGFDWLTMVLSVLSMILVVLLLVCYPLICKRLSNWQRLKEETRTAFSEVARFPRGRVMEICGWSMLRYILFSMQLLLLLAFVGVWLSLEEAVLGVTLYYLLVTFTPSVSVAEPAIRGSWAVVVFAKFTPLVPQIAIATVLVWVVNTLCPMLVGSVVGLKQKRTVDKT